MNKADLLRALLSLKPTAISVSGAGGKSSFLKFLADNLAANGKVEMRWQETFWAHGFGRVIDRYGVPWMINVVKQQH